MKKRLPFLFLLFISFKGLSLPFSPPANDDCGAAIDITLANTALFSTVGATMSAPLATIAGANDDDVWFKFTASSAAATAYKIELSNFTDAAGGSFPPSAVMEIWNGCSGTAVTVTNTQGSVIMATGLTQGAVYYIRVYTNGTALRANFNIAVTPLTAPTNDNCSAAITLTAQLTCAGGEGPFTTEGASASSQLSGDGTGKDDDVWFKFTTGTANLYGKVSIITPVYSGIVSGGSVVELWGNCGDANSLKFLPFTTTNGNLGTLSPNSTYYIRVYTYGTSSWLHSFNLCVSLNVSPPANDTYFTAASMALNGGTTCTTAITGATTAGATTEPPNDCNTLSQPKDVWFKFTAITQTGHIQITNKALLAGHASTNSILWMQLFDGSNTSPVRACSNTESLDFDGHNDASKLSIGHTYYLRVYNDDPQNACSFDICTLAPPGPVYNTCAKAVNISVSPNEYCSAAIPLNNINAGASSADGNCVNSIGSDIWLKFVVPAVANDLQISLQNYVSVAGSANPLTGFVVYSGLNCGALTPVGCGLGNTVNLPDLTHIGPIVYVRLIFFNVTDRGQFNVCLHHLPAVATNVDCTHAMTINASTDGSAAFVHATTVGSANDYTLTDCSGNQYVFNNAVWFKFTAAATHQIIDIEDLTGENGGNVYAGYKFYTSDGAGSCTGLTVAACTGNILQQSAVLPTLVVGNVYFVQIMVNTFNGDNAGFNIRAVAATPPTNDERAGAITVIENPFYKTSLATQGTFRFSTISPSPLTDATYAGDVWYSFKAATTVATLRLDNNGSYTRVVVYNSDGTTVFFDPGAANAVTAMAGLTVGNTYYIRVYNPQAINSTTAGSVFFISVFGTPSLNAADAAAAGCQTADGPVHSSNSNTWLHITDHGQMLASIFDGNTGLLNGMGDITAAYYMNTADLRHNSRGIDYLDRNYSFSPAAEPAAGHPIQVIFYFTKQEFDRLAASLTSRVSYLNDLSISAFSGLSCNGIIGNTDEVSYRLVDYGNLSSNVYYAEVSLPHLSGFYLKTVEDATLPVTCGGFTYSLNENTVQLSWKTVTELNSSHFEVQKSVNGLDYSAIAVVKASGSSNKPVEYQYTDNGIKGGLNYYYRIKAYDKDGRSESFCNTLKIAAKGSGTNLFGDIYPNPAGTVANINILKQYAGKVSIQVVNVIGQVLSQQSLPVTNATQTITIATAHLPKGTYFVKLLTTEGVFTQKLVKQ